MNCLVIDCSSRWIVCGLLSHGSSGSEVAGPQIRRDAPRESSTRLVIEIRSLIEKAGCRPDWILCSLGPGSFTGIRIGVSTARNLAQLWDLPTAGIDTLTLYGRAIAEIKPQPFAVMLDGRQKRFYTKAVHRSNSKEVHREPVLDLLPEEFEQNIGLPQVYCDAPLSLKIPGVEVNPIPEEALTARSFLETALSLGLPDPDATWRDLSPMYIRTDPAHAKYPAGFNHSSINRH